MAKGRYRTLEKYGLGAIVKMCRSVEEQHEFPAIALADLKRRYPQFLSEDSADKERDDG